MMKVGDAHCELLHFLSTPILHNLSNSFLKVTLWIFGTGKGLWCLGLVPSFSSRCTGSVRKSPSVPSNRSSNLFNNFKYNISNLTKEKIETHFFQNYRFLTLFNTEPTPSELFQTYCLQFYQKILCSCNFCDYAANMLQICCKLKNINKFNIQHSLTL